MHYLVSGNVKSSHLLFVLFNNPLVITSQTIVSQEISRSKVIFSPFMTISVLTVVEFYGETVKFTRFIHLNTSSKGLLISCKTFSLRIVITFAFLFIYERYLQLKKIDNIFDRIYSPNSIF